MKNIQTLLARKRQALQTEAAHLERQAAGVAAKIQDCRSKIAFLDQLARETGAKPRATKPKAK